MTLQKLAIELRAMADALERGRHRVADPPGWIRTLREAANLLDAPGLRLEQLPDNDDEAAAPLRDGDHTNLLPE